MIIKQLSQTGSLIKPPESERINSGMVVLENGEEVGEHITHKREELIIILQGQATIILEGKETLAKENSFIYIPENKKHNVKNNSSQTLKYIYIVALL